MPTRFLIIVVGLFLWVCSADASNQKRVQITGYRVTSFTNAFAQLGNNGREFTDGDAAGTSLGENPGAPIFITQAAGVQLAGNRVEALGQFNRMLVDATPSAQIDHLNAGVVIPK